MEILDVLGWTMSKPSCSREKRKPIIFFTNISTKTNDSCGQFYSICCSAWSLPVPINQRERLHKPPLAQHHLPPPTAGIKGKVPEETGGRYPSPAVIGVHGQSWFQPDYEYPGNEALCALLTLSKIQMETGTLSRITKFGGIPLSFFSSLFSFTI